MKYLDEALKTYAESNAYPFHMPGHKRLMDVAGIPTNLDITEISGFDDLHHADGVLSEAMTRAAKNYDAEQTFYLVNGSTVGILASIYAATDEGDRILVARNCHKSVYHAAILRHLTVDYVETEWTKMWITGKISTESVENMLKSHPKTKAVVISSPSYYGFVTDVESCARVIHSLGITLIVDEAHGAHFGFHPDFPETSVRLGADFVIQSLHKTLPSFTQTALLHCNRPELADRAAEGLRMFETSSPSYLFMAGMDACMRYMAKEGKAALEKLSRNLDDFYEEISVLNVLQVVTEASAKAEGAFAFDKSRIVIKTNRASNFTGHDLFERLRDEYKLELEMSDIDHAVAISTIADTKEGFDRLAHALIEIDMTLEHTAGTDETGSASKQSPEKSDDAQAFIKNPVTCQMWEAKNAAGEIVALKDAIGRTVQEFIYVYPPGSPAIVPGEVMTQSLYDEIMRWKDAGLEVQGTVDQSVRTIRVIEFAQGE